ncbi:hypothetical protein PG996_011050 [Apiospora saccharicola]|uniref:Uncharacterized protein n=1 Tax=Apiospora saccharicola TaxID=335842 RepID=A0ABR1UDY1_9PEZI
MMMSRPGSIPYYDDSSTGPLEHLYSPLDLSRGFAIDWQRDILLLDLEAGASVWRWHPHGLPVALRRATKVIVVHDHWRGVGVDFNFIFSTTTNWMHRVVMHFGPRLRGLWFMTRHVWRETEQALLAVPWRNSVYGRVNRGFSDDDEDGAAPSSPLSSSEEEEEEGEGVDPWDVLVMEDVEVSRDLVANGHVSLSDLPPQLGLTTEAIDGWSTPVRVGTITGAR